MLETAASYGAMLVQAGKPHQGLTVLGRVAKMYNAAYGRNDIRTMRYTSTSPKYMTLFFFFWF